MNPETPPTSKFLSQPIPPPPPPPKEEAPRVRFTQINPMVEDAHQQSGLYGLDDKGRIWFLNYVTRKWWHIPGPMEKDKSLNIYKVTPNE